MLRKTIFVLSHEIGNPKFYPVYRKLLKNQWKSKSELIREQEKQLFHLIQYSYNNVPYYKRLFKSLNLTPQDISRLKHLEKIPPINKEIIKKNWSLFVPINLKKTSYLERSTGGSTGTPFRYLLDKFDRFLSAAIWYRGWGYAGYALADKVAFFGGSSLVPTFKSDVFKILNEFARNVKFLSSFDMDSISINRYLEILYKFKPKFIYGYASSLYFFANWVERNRFKLDFLEGIFSTSEKLFPHMRKKIEDTFSVDVYDCYGLNDGGVSAYECKEHSGLHIDTERSIMEIVDDQNNQIESGQGKILATSLYNYSFPFIRYDTSDVGYLLPDVCPCGRGYPLLEEIVGRQQEFVITPEGKWIHGEFFTHIFWEICGVDEFQVIQESLNNITVNIVINDDFDDNSIEKIKYFYFK